MDVGRGRFEGVEVREEQISGTAKPRPVVDGHSPDLIAVDGRAQRRTRPGAHLEITGLRQTPDQVVDEQPVFSPRHPIHLEHARINRSPACQGVAEGLPYEPGQGAGRRVSRFGDARLHFHMVFNRKL
jgi:hypothetical protein